MLGWWLTASRFPVWKTKRAANRSATSHWSFPKHGYTHTGSPWPLKIFKLQCKGWATWVLTYFAITAARWPVAYWHQAQRVAGSWADSSTLKVQCSPHVWSCMHASIYDICMPVINFTSPPPFQVMVLTSFDHVQVSVYNLWMFMAKIVHIIYQLYVYIYIYSQLFAYMSTTPIYSTELWWQDPTHYPRLGFGEGLNPLGSFGMTLGNRIYWDRTMSYGGFLKWWYPQIVNLWWDFPLCTIQQEPPISFQMQATKCKQPYKASSCSKEALGKWCRLMGLTSQGDKRVVAW